MLFPWTGSQCNAPCPGELVGRAACDARRPGASSDPSVGASHTAACMVIPLSLRVLRTLRAEPQCEAFVVELFSLISQYDLKLTDFAFRIRSTDLWQRMANFVRDLFFNPSTNSPFRRGERHEGKI